MSTELLLEYLQALNKLVCSPKHRPAIEEKIMAVCKAIDKRVGIPNDEVTIYADGIEVAKLAAEHIEIDKRCKGRL